MKTTTRILILLLLVCALIAPTTAYAAGNQGDKVIFGGNYTLREGETLNGDLVVFGGNVTLETASTINGDAVVFGGNVSSNGTINGNLVALGGIVNLGSQAQVNGDLTAVGSSFQQDPAARISGNIVTEDNIPLDFKLNKNLNLLQGNFPRWQLNKVPFASPAWFLFRVLIWSGLAVLIGLFIQDQAAVINKTAFSEPLLSGVVGLGVILVAPLVLIALIITILLSPVSLIGIFALIAAWVVGLVSVSIEVGRKLSQSLKQTWPVPVMAGLGMFILTLLFNGFSQLVPCVGWLPKFVLGSWVMGAVILTRFGTHAYPSQDAALAAPVVQSDEELPEDFPAAEKEQAKPIVDATPAARELAEKEGIDLSQVPGTGSEGRVTINDVRKALKNRK